MEMTETLLKAGAQEIIIADTIGAANPSQVKSLFDRLTSSFDKKLLATHFHDTRAMGLANAYAAIECGIRKFDASIGGLGGCPFAPGAAGNLATEDLVSMAHQMGYETGIDEKALLKTSHFAGEIIGQQIGGRMAGWMNYQMTK
jgi:hydroxymethylglutaryl-CoA lyase